MLGLFWASDSQTPEDFREELLTSTTRKLGVNLRYERPSSHRREKGIEEELSRRIRLMEKIPESHPYEIFVYNDKGFKSFTSQVKKILGRDLERKPQKVAVPKYLDYTRAMLKDEIEKAKKAQSGVKEVTKDQEDGGDQLKEDYEQLMEEYEAMESDYTQLTKEHKQLKKEHAELQREHERVLHDLSGRKEKETKAPEQVTASAPVMRPRDEGLKQPPVLGGKTFPPEIPQRAREAQEVQEAQEARERASAQARDKEAREQEEAKIREWEEEHIVQEMNKRSRELREERVAREKQRLRDPRQDIPGTGRRDVKAEDVAPQLPRHSIHGGVTDSEPAHQTRDLGELLQGQKTGYPNMQQGGPYQQKPAPLRQANDLKSVSFDLPIRTPTIGQVPPVPQRPIQQLPVEQISAPLQQTNTSKSVPFGLPTRTPNMDQVLPVQQQSAPLQQIDTSTRVPFGLPTRTPNMDQGFPIQQKSAPLQQANELKNVSFNLPNTTASTPIDSRLPTQSSQNGPQLGIPLRSQEPLRGPEPRSNTTSNRAGMAERVDRLAFFRRANAP